MLTLPARCLVLGLLWVGVLAGCGGGGKADLTIGGGNTSTTNANAGANVTVNEGASVTLNGIGTDPTGAISSYSWTQVSGPEVLINPSDSASVTIVTPQVLANQVIVLRLSVTGTSGTDTDDVEISVVNVPRISGTVSGKVINGLTGDSISGAMVQIDSTTVSSDANGDFSATVDVSERIAITVTSAGFVEQQKITSLTSDRFEDYLTIRVLPVSETTTFDPAVGATLTVASSVVSIVIPANALATSTGGAPVGNVTASLTLIDPRNDPEVLIGDYLGTSGGGALANIESFGAIAVVIVDSTGALLELIDGNTATVQIPSLPRGDSIAPSTAPLYQYDGTAHNWVENGTSALVDATPDYYTAAINELGIWNVAAAYPAVSISGCIEDEFGIPVFGARVTSSGDEYNGTAGGYSNVDGTFTISAKASSRVLVSATNATSVSNTVVVNTGTGNASISQCLLLGRAQASIKLSWGKDPEDLDSHLFTPAGAHVYYANPGALTAAPFAALDVDDTTGYGPEVVTVTQLAPGQYKYYVHNFEGTFGPGQTDSPTKVELRVSGRTYTFAPPSGEGSNVWWYVFNMDVGSGGAVSVTPVGTWQSTDPSDAVSPMPQKMYRQDKNFVTDP